MKDDCAIPGGHIKQHVLVGMTRRELLGDEFPSRIVREHVSRRRIGILNFEWAPIRRVARRAPDGAASLSSAIRCELLKSVSVHHDPLKKRRWSPDSSAVVQGSACNVSYDTSPCVRHARMRWVFVCVGGVHRR